jgi:hypothetical protein
MHKLYLYIILVVGISGYLLLGKVALEISEGVPTESTKITVGE